MLDEPHTVYSADWSHDDRVQDGPAVTVWPTAGAHALVCTVLPSTDSTLGLGALQRVLHMQMYGYYGYYSLWVLQPLC